MTKHTILSIAASILLFIVTISLIGAGLVLSGVVSHPFDTDQSRAFFDEKTNEKCDVDF